MTSEWEQFEELIREEMRKVYSEIAIEYAMNPTNVGHIANTKERERKCHL